MRSSGFGIWKIRQGRRSWEEGWFDQDLDIPLLQKLAGENGSGLDEILNGVGNGEKEQPNVFRVGGENRINFKNWFMYRSDLDA